MSAIFVALSQCPARPQAIAPDRRARAISLPCPRPRVEQGTPEGVRPLTAVLLDTSCIVALLDRSERHHQECVDVVSALAAPLITCEAVIAESCYLVRDLKGAAAAVVENVDRGIFQIPYRLSGNALGVTKLVKKYAGVPMDFADACLVDMASDYHTGRILTLDADFRVYRWGRNRPFELLLTI